MGVPRVQENGLHISACLILRLQKPNPHEVRVMVNNQQTIPQTVRRGNVDMTPQATREMLKCGRWFLRCLMILRG
jgi:hypothetical protein